MPPWRGEQLLGIQERQRREKLKKKEPAVREKTILSTHPVYCGCVVIVWKDSVLEGFIKDSNPVTVLQKAVLHSFSSFKVIYSSLVQQRSS